MIYLSTTQSSNVIVTCRENASNASPYYTWKIINRDSYNQYIFSPDNLSTSLYYDEFQINIGTSTSLTSSVVLDCVQGEYDYFIYETITQYELNLNNSIGLMESGILHILGTSSQIISFTQSDADVVKVFNEL